jgi:hypothetical protein
MVISSRTPEGQPNHCPVCGADLRIEPSDPAGDAPCPQCGLLLWFTRGAFQVIKPLPGASLEPESLGRLFDREGPPQLVGAGSSGDAGAAKRHRRSTVRPSRVAVIGMWGSSCSAFLILMLALPLPATPGAAIIMTYFKTGMALLVFLPIWCMSRRPRRKLTGKTPMVGGLWDQQLDG